MKKKIIDERGFLFGKVSIVDVLAVLLVAALLLMLYVRFLAPSDTTPGSVADTGKVQVDYVLKVTGARKWHLNTIRSGDTIYNGEYGAVMGTVKAVRSEQAVSNMTTLDGKVVSVPLEGYYDLYITITTECTTSAGGYYLFSSLELNRNMSLAITTMYDIVSGTVYSID